MGLVDSQMVGTVSTLHAATNICRLDIFWNLPKICILESRYLKNIFESEKILLVIFFILIFRINIRKFPFTVRNVQKWIIQEIFCQQLQRKDIFSKSYSFQTDEQYYLGTVL